MVNKEYYAVVSGIFASFGSLAGKFISAKDVLEVSLIITLLEND